MKGWDKESLRHSAAKKFGKAPPYRGKKCEIKLKKGDLPDSLFDAEQLKKGIQVEKEHTNDESIAKQIAKAHLSEDKAYYSKLAIMEGEQYNPYKDWTMEELKDERRLMREKITEIERNADKYFEKFGYNEETAMDYDRKANEYHEEYMRLTKEMNRREKKKAINKETYGDKVKSMDAIQDEKWYLVGSGFGSEDEAKSYAHNIKVVGYKIAKSKQGSGFDVIVKGKNALGSYFMGSLREY